MKKIKIGVVAVDSGKLMICDPMYLRDWKNDKFEAIRKYEDLQTGNIYTYKKDFTNFSDILIDQKTVKQLIQEKRLKEIEEDVEIKDFSFSNLVRAVNTKQFVQFNFPAGHAGLAIAFTSGNGDGEYPVYAEMEEDQLKKIYIDFE